MIVGVLHPGEMGASCAAQLRSTGVEVIWAGDGRSPATVRRAEAADLRDVGSIAAVVDGEVGRALIPHGTLRAESRHQASGCAGQGCVENQHAGDGGVGIAGGHGVGGLGAQYKLGSWAVRAEYERFNAAGENPSLLSVGITWTFF